MSWMSRWRCGSERDSGSAWRVSGVAAGSNPFIEKSDAVLQAVSFFLSFLPFSFPFFFSFLL